MTEKNGERLISPHVSETAAAATSPVVLFLDKLLTDARTGAFTSMATVAVGPHGQLMTGWAGGQRGEMYVGAAMVQQGLLKEITQPAPRGGIIPVRGVV